MEASNSLRLSGATSNSETLSIPELCLITLSGIWPIDLNHRFRWVSQFVFMCVGVAKYSCNSLGLSWWNQGAGRFSWHWLRLQWSGALPARSAPVATTLLALLRSEGVVSLSRERSSGCSGRGDLKSSWPSDVISDVKDNWYVGAVSNGLVDWKAKWLCIKMLSKLLFHDIYMVVFCVFTAPVSPIASHLPWSLQLKIP